MDYTRFYKLLFQPIEERIGHVDDATLMAIIGFDCGGPLSLCTVGHGRDRFVTYVSCELAVREEQHPGDVGRYEVMITCDDEGWAREVLSAVGRMSMESVLGHGHTVDIAPVVGPDCPVQGLVIEEFARVPIDARDYGILRFHGVTRPELEFAMSCGADELLERLGVAGIYPRTSVHRSESFATSA